MRLKGKVALITGGLTIRLQEDVVLANPEFK
jgi:hypothetical protein